MSDEYDKMRADYDRIKQAEYERTVAPWKERAERAERELHALREWSGVAARLIAANANARAWARRWKRAAHWYRDNLSDARREAKHLRRLWKDAESCADASAVAGLRAEIAHLRTRLGKEEQ